MRIFSKVLFSLLFLATCSQATAQSNALATIAQHKITASNGAQETEEGEADLDEELETGLRGLLSKVSFSGSADVYFRQNLSGDFGDAPATSFANLPGFALGMANLVASHEGDKVGFTADLVFGPRGEDATFLSPILRPGGSSNIINQLYAYWNISDKLTATIGNFNTFLGYEVISPSGNFNYSTSYMFSYGPFSHTGLKFDVDLGSGFSLMAGVFNPTDATEYNPGSLDDDGEFSADYAGGLQLGYSLDQGSVFLNAIVSEDFYQLDLTAGYDLSEEVYVGINATTAQDLFFGVAGYFQYATSDDLKLGARAEYFGDRGLGVTSLDESILDFTLSANYSINNLTLIPEFRIDTYSDDTDALSSLLLAAVYSF